MLAGVTTPDGYELNSDEVWMVNSIVQTKGAEIPGIKQGNSEDEGYNEWGLSNTALAMIKNSREENAKYGEVKRRQDCAGNLCLLCQWVFSQLS